MFGKTIQEISFVKLKIIQNYGQQKQFKV